MNKKTNILCFGEVLWDRLPSGSKPGGAPLNVAVHLNSIGLNAAIASRIGDDKSGRELKKFLTRAGVNTKLLQTDKIHETSEVLVHLDKNKNATYEICEPVAWDFIEHSAELDKTANNSDFIVYGSLASRNKTSFETLLSILENKGFKLMDVNLRPPYDKREIIEKLLHKTNVAKLNDEELDVIAAWHSKSDVCETDKIKWLAYFYQLEMVCITKGRKGAVLLQNNKIYEHPGFRIKTEDTVGAGDAFLAGLIASIAENKSPEKSLAFACATGAFVASKKGATPEYNFTAINNILLSTDH